MGKKHIIPALLLFCTTLSVPVSAKAGIGSWFTWGVATVASVAAAAAIPSVRNTIVFGSGWICSGILKAREYFTNRKLDELDQRVESGFSEQKNGVALLAHELMIFRGLINGLHEKINVLTQKVDTIDKRAATKDDLNGVERRLKNFIGGLFGVMSDSNQSRNAR